MEKTEMLNKLKEIFDGRDPLAEAQQKMADMDHEQLTALVLVAANKVGTLLKGGDYEDAFDAAIHLNSGIDVIFATYESAWMNTKATTCDTGNA